jgi:hypothetical protein
MKNLKKLALVAIAAFALTTLTGYLYCPPVDPLGYTVLLPNPDDCSSFFMCSNGVPILQKCPGGLHFNANLNVCDFIGSAGCNPTPGVGEEEDDDDGGDGPYGGGSGGGSTSGEGSSQVGCFMVPSSINSPSPITYCSRSPSPPNVGTCITYNRWEASTENWICNQ